MHRAAPRRVARARIAQVKEPERASRGSRASSVRVRGCVRGRLLEMSRMQPRYEPPSGPETMAAPGVGNCYFVTHFHIIDTGEKSANLKVSVDPGARFAEFDGLSIKDRWLSRKVDPRCWH